MNINIRDFMYDNITPYDGDGSFLVGPSKNTKKLREKCTKLLDQEFKNGGVLEIDTKNISTITSHKPGYIDKKLEKIIGLQTDAPLKRAIKPFGGRRIVKKACEEHGVELDPKVIEIFTKYRKSHNDGVFSAYTSEMRKYRKNKILSGLPDNYARGRVIGDYRRIALYGMDALIEAKKLDKKTLLGGIMDDEKIRLREEISEQIQAMKDIKTMAESYGFDISQAATNAQEAIQWVYFGFLAGVKEQDGAAMSLGSTSSFFDIYIEKDLKSGKISEEEAQELVDQFIIKLRLIRQLRMDAYNDIFAGDPTRTTEAIAGSFRDGKHKVTKTSFRFLQSLYNLGPAPEPNLTVLRSKDLPQNFKKFCTQASIDTSAIQYENDDLMKKVSHCDDNGIACCVSQTEMGNSMQFFGARCNIAKALLYAINEGKDEITGIEVIPGIPKLKNNIKLNYHEVLDNYILVMEKLAKEYVNTMNVIHYMHDKYYYEKAQMAFINSIPKRYMSFGIAGLSVATDSLSAIKYGKTEAIRNKEGIAIDFKTQNEFPKFGNDDNHVDELSEFITSKFIKELSKHKIYRNAEATLSILTITANVMYGHYTGTTPDGRKYGEPFAPGANPMHGRDTHGAIASLNSVAKISYKDCRDGVSNTFSIVPISLGANNDEKTNNLTQLINGYFNQGAQHLNINVFNRETLEDAMKHPEKYPQLTIRVSGYAVNFIKLSKEQQLEVISRTFHEKM